MKEEGIQDKFYFMNPNVITFFRDKNEEDSQKFERLNEMARFVANRLITSSPNQLVLMPSNVGYHWILTVVDPFNEHIFLMDPMSHKIRSLDWKCIVNTALTMFKEEKGMQGKKKATWEVVPGPRQPDEVQCSFYAMRFMREITGGAETIDRDSLRSIFKQAEYSIAEIDEVRREWADCVQDFVYDD